MQRKRFSLCMHIAAVGIKGLIYLEVRACFSVHSGILNNLRKIMTPEPTFKNQLLTSFDIHHIFQAVQYSGLMCKLEFRQCLFGSLTFEMMAKWLKAYSIPPNGGVIQKLRCVYIFVYVCTRQQCAITVLSPGKRPWALTAQTPKIEGGWLHREGA